MEEQNIEPEDISGQATESDGITNYTIDGDFIDNLTDKKFRIISAHEESFKDKNNPNKTNKKTILQIELADGTSVKYFPNMTSIKKIIAKKGLKYSNWAGYTGEFTTLNQMINNQFKKVIYIK